MIKLIKSTFYKEEETKKALSDFIMGAKQLSIGEQCAEFERQFAVWQGRSHCALYNSGSSANLALIQALLNLGRIKKGALVGISALTWPTNVMPLIQLGLTPVPVDVALSTLNISPALLERAYKKTKFSALFITNLLGFSDDIAAIKDFCATNEILLLEDNCEALGSRYAGTKLGNFGIASTFSFFVGHHMSTIEGGAVCTDDKELDTMLRMVRSHGWDRNLSAPEQALLRNENNVDDFYGKYTFYDLGYNIRPTEIQGFLGLNQLQYLDEMIAKRESNFQAFSELYHNPDFERMILAMDTVSNFAVPVVCKNKEKQAEYIKRCNDASIEVRPIVGGLMIEQPFYKKYLQDRTIYDDPVNARYIHQYGFYFGNNPEMTPSEISLVVKTLS